MISLAKFSLMLSTISPLLSVTHFEISENSAEVASSWKVIMYCFKEDSVEIEPPSLTSLANTKIDEENTTIDITFTFELLLQSYSLFTFSAIIETIISQNFCAEMKTFYNNLGNDIKEFYNNKDLNQNNDDLNEIKIKKHKKPKKIVS